LSDFLGIQTRTDWGRVLATFAPWCDPQPVWMTLDIGNGLGLLAKLIAEYECHAIGFDLDHKVFG
jgi:2-polyprenyl-3-methyl-5-hydroxy-6-metoxy-1,4-benzoquinol methylase